MKKIYTIIFLFISCYSFSQSNWSLFPIGQKTFYQFNDYMRKAKITTYLADSVEIQGNISKILFNSKSPSPDYDACYSGVVDALHPHQLFFSYDIPDSLFERNDTVANDFNNFQFYFLPQASIGQSWHIINNAGVLFTDLQITCVSMQVENFLGISDSVKSFQLQGSSPSYYDTITIKLSEHYGLIKFIPFQFLYSHDVEAVLNTMVGLKNNSTSLGTTFMWQDFFIFNVGDVFLYRHTTTPFIGPEEKEYYKDSITQVTLTADSLIVFYATDYLSNSGVLTSTASQSLNCKITELESILNASANWIAIGNIPFFHPYYPGLNTTQIFYTGNYQDDDSCNGYDYDILFYEHLLDTTNCALVMITDASYEMDFRTGTGITKIYNNNFFPDEMLLIGSKINGVICGNIDITQGINEIAASEPVSVYPVPANDFFEVKISSKSSESYQICNLGGQLISGGLLNEEKIDIRPLTPGIYVLKIKIDDRIYFKKIVKQ